MPIVPTESFSNSKTEKSPYWKFQQFPNQNKSREQKNKYLQFRTSKNKSWILNFQINSESKSILVNRVVSENC